MMKQVRKNGGQGTTELALLFPILFGLFFATIQLIIFIQSATMTKYASFVAARSFQVYGDRNLKEIEYPKVTTFPNTNENETIVEAAAESVIFESLSWEEQRVKVKDVNNVFSRVYEDYQNNHNVSYNGSAKQNSESVVQINFLCGGAGSCDQGTGVDVTYCAPITFPGIDTFFAAIQKKNPCKISQGNRTYHGIALTQRTEFGREPVEK